MSTLRYSVIETALCIGGNLHESEVSMVRADEHDRELAALREELAACKTQKAWWVDSAKTLDKRLTAAEQRNAALAKAATEFMEYAESGWDHFPDVGVNLRAALTKPTKSGASE
jgi:hypothetical protein